jgi:hypothetical protein
MNKGWQIQKAAMEVKTAQKQLDELVPGKVKVSTEYDYDRKCYILAGEYDMHMQFDGKVHSTKSTWTESIDRFYTDCKLFVGFFKQRAKFMNASIEEQIAFDGHPATF